MHTPQQLLERILASPYFRDDPRLGDLLRCICLHTQTGHLEALHEHDIGVEALGMEPGYDTREQPVVVQLVAETRNRLQSFFQNEGRQEPLRLVIPPGEFRAFFFEADPRELEQAALQPTALERFWAPYFQSGMRNLLIHGHSGEESVAVSEAYAMTRLAIAFDKQGASLLMYPAGAVEVLDLAGTNLILTGGPATNAVLAQFRSQTPARALVQRIGAETGRGAITILTAPSSADLLPIAIYVTEEATLARTAQRFAGGVFPPDFELALNP
ncbi:MAG: hypothetical protein HY235_16915 [Acidobacteria bacterium]|nr:hypothetical protein [Acidobacteriota bacterium]